MWEPVPVEGDAASLDDAGRGVKHVLTHQTIYAQLIRIDATRLTDHEPLPYGLPPIAQLLKEYRWATPDEREGYAMPRLMDKLLADR